MTDNPYIEIRYAITGQKRKELAKALGEILSQEPVYLFAPTFAFQIGNFTVTREGTILCPENCTREIAERIIRNLEKRDFTPVSTNLSLLVVSLPREIFDDASITRLRNLVASKKSVLTAALGTHELEIDVREDKIFFPWFSLTGADGEAEAYTMLISALGKMAREQKRISSREKQQENLKYAMRLFLVRLGFVGDEYKQARKILLRDLSGNCSWKAGHAPIRRDTPNDSINTTPAEEHSSEEVIYEK